MKFPKENPFDICIPFSTIEKKVNFTPTRVQDIFETNELN